jgi:hypothetical protein
MATPSITDAVGVIVTKDKTGRYGAHRIAVVDGKFEHQRELTNGRSKPSAVREAALDLDMISLEISRNIIRLGEEGEDV